MSPKFLRTALVAVLLTALLAACSPQTPAVAPGPGSDVYVTERLKLLRMDAPFSASPCRWTLASGDASAACIAADGTACLAVFARTGTYEFDFTDGDGLQARVTVRVVEEQVAYSPWIAEVDDYSPAPGQFVNTMPPYDPGDTASDMCLKALMCIGGTAAEPVTLGAWGGSITFAFDHTVPDLEGADFRILGNAFLNSGSGQGGSSEPGTVWVSLDTNGNGRPDDPWFELRGSEADNPLTTRGYRITYHRPQDGHQPVTSSARPWASDTEYIRWTDNRGDAGWLEHLTFHTNSYFPAWVADDELTFTGTLLPPNSQKLTQGGAAYYVLEPYAWGYADNQPNSDEELTAFDISNAVDSEGRPAGLPGADFIKVVTGINQSSGHLGECSTEVAGAVSLHVGD